MSSKPTEIVRQGLAAWRQGDFGTVEKILDRNVKWHATDPGEWDCHGRDEVNERVVLMQDYRTEAEALAAVEQK